MGKRENGEYGRVCGIPSAAVFFSNFFVDFIHKHTNIRANERMAHTEKTEAIKGQLKWR